MCSKVAKSPKDDTVRLSIDSAGCSVISSNGCDGRGNVPQRSFIVLLEQQPTYLYYVAPLCS
ncbi:hypothetical protein HDV62DRAFT_356854 [Trichoderma sp. SZMC 28011]